MREEEIRVALEHGSTATVRDFAYRSSMPSNVLGGEPATLLPPVQALTGFYRDGFCRTGPGDLGLAHRFAR